MQLHREQVAVQRPATSRWSDGPLFRCVRGQLAGRIRVEIGCGIVRKVLDYFGGFADRCLVAFFRGWVQVRKKEWSVGRNGVGYDFLAEHGKDPLESWTK